MTTRVNAGLGYTRNLGDFNSLRIDVGVADDARQGESVQQAFDRVYGFVEDKLIEKVREVELEIQKTQASAAEEVKDARRKRKQ